MKCIIGHEIRTETGFKVFEAGRDYPAQEIGDRAAYFEAAGPATARRAPAAEAADPPRRKSKSGESALVDPQAGAAEKASEINEEVTEQ